MSEKVFEDLTVTYRGDRLIEFRLGQAHICDLVKQDGRYYLVFKRERRPSVTIEAEILLKALRPHIL